MSTSKETIMKPTSTVAEFIRRAREAGHDSFGLANDLEASMALASVHRGRFVGERTEMQLKVVQRVTAIGGGDAGSCLEFSLSTIERAFTRLRRLVSLPLPTSADGRANDRRCAQGLNRALTVYGVASFCLMYVLDETVHAPPSVLAAILEVVRAGAMRAYEHAANGLAVRLAEKKQRDSVDADMPESPVEDEADDVASLLDEHIEDAAALLADLRRRGAR
jgi:hypothetical protein